MQSRLDNSREAVMTELVSVDLLILDDFALDTMTKDESKDVYQLFLERTGRGSMIEKSIDAVAHTLARLARSYSTAPLAPCSAKPVAH